MVGFSLGLGFNSRNPAGSSGGGAGGGGANFGNVLDADAVFRGRVLDANPLTPRMQAWVNDPAYADRVGKYQSGGPNMALQDVLFGSVFTFARASVATDWDAYGLLGEVAAANIRQGYDPVSRLPAGWLLEGAATNQLRNPRAEGAVLGLSTASGAPPTYWGWGNPAGMTSKEIVGVGTINGLRYVDVRYIGSGAGAFEMTFDSGPAAAISQTWTGSVWLALVAGSLAGFGASVLIYEHPANTPSATSFLTVTTTLQRFSVSRTFSQGTTTSTSMRLNLAPPAGAWDFTLRIAAPQQEQNYLASSIMLPPVSAPAVSTRAADALSIQGGAFSSLFGVGRSVVNSILQSQTMDVTPWTYSQASITANAGVAPDGTTTADKLVESTATASQHFMAQSVAWVAGTTYTLSVYAKAVAGERSWIRLIMPGTPFGGSAPSCYFDVANGLTGTLGVGLGNIVSVGSGWYRCSLTGTASVSASGTFTINLASGVGGGGFLYDGDASGTFGALYWGAQLEVTPVAPSASLLASPESFAATVWAKLAATVTPNAITAPDLTLSGDKLCEDATTAGHYVSQGMPVTVALPYTLSVFAKGIERTALQLIATAIGTANANVIANYDLTGAGQASAIGGGSASISAVAGAAGWYRCTLTVPAASQTGTSSIQARTLAAYSVPATADSHAGTLGSGLSIWGLQMVQAAAAVPYVALSALVSGYVPTTSAAVTKSGVVEGCAIVDCQMDSNNGASVARMIMTIDDGGTANRLEVRPNLSGTIIAAGSYVNGMGSSPLTAGAPTYGTPMRIGLRFGNGVLSLCLNGGTISSYAISTIPLSALRFGNLSSASSPMNGRIRLARALAYAPSDSEFTARCVLGA